VIDNLESELEARGAVLRGHFQYASGRHGELYIEKFRILQWPDITSQLCEQIADHFEGKANLVAGPTTGGVILSTQQPATWASVPSSRNVSKMVRGANFVVASKLARATVC